MANPENPDLETQTKRHIGPMVGLAICGLIALFGFIYYIGYETEGDEAAQPASETVETEPAQEQLPIETAPEPSPEQIPEPAQ